MTLHMPTSNPVDLAKQAEDRRAGSSLLSFSAMVFSGVGPWVREPVAGPCARGPVGHGQSEGCAGKSSCKLGTR